MPYITLRIGKHLEFINDMRRCMFSCWTDSGSLVKIHHTTDNVMAWVSIGPKHLPESSIHRFTFSISSWPKLKLEYSAILLYNNSGKKTKEFKQDYDESTIQNICCIVTDATEILAETSHYSD